MDLFFCHLIMFEVHVDVGDQNLSGFRGAIIHFVLHLSDPATPWGLGLGLLGVRGRAAPCPGSWLILGLSLGFSCCSCRKTFP